MNLRSGLKKLITTLLDAIFPRQCINCFKYGSFLCIRCSKRFLEPYSEHICHVCRKETILDKYKVHKCCEWRTALKEVKVCYHYNTLTQSIIAQIKYNLFYAYVELVVELIFATLDISDFKSCTLVPIPLHKHKYNLRGFNQAELIAENLAIKLQEYGCTVDVVSAVKRIKNTKTQVGMSKFEREHNLNNAFELDMRKWIKVDKARTIWLIDDVMTTGTTLEKCAEILVQSGANDIRALVFARG